MVKSALIYGAEIWRLYDDRRRINATEMDALIFKNRASYVKEGCNATLQMLHFVFFFSTNINTEYFKHAAHSPFFSSKCRLFHNATLFGFCIFHILHTGCAKI
jgi:hypothetical protein